MTSHSDADDEADYDAETFIQDLRGLSQWVYWSEIASTALVCSDADSFSESPPFLARCWAVGATRNSASIIGTHNNRDFQMVKISIGEGVQDIQD